MVRACSSCGSEKVVKNGKRKTENNSKKQLYYCNSCGTSFTEPGFKQKSYPGKVIIEALKLYSIGNSLNQTSKQVNKRFKVNTSRNTVYNWVKEYQSVCKILGDRDKYTRGFKSDNIIRENLYIHQGLEYPFRIHRKKLEYAEKHGFEKLTQFLESIDEEINHALFENGVRSSQSENRNQDFQVQEYRNNACTLAKLALQANHNRKKRHDSVQDLMLKTDKATIATELPVWYYSKKLENTVTGHIDILQTRNNKIHILDYKPNAEKVEPVSQLRNYVKALSYRTGIPRDKFKAAWFNENVYRELV